MIFHRRVIPMLSVMVLLAGCAQPQTTRVQNELGQINQKLRDLTNRAVALEQQNTLNANSTSGVYLLPAAYNRALLDSSIGKLSLELSKVEPEANGTRALLTIRTMNTLTLPAFRAQLDWGALDPVSGKPLTGDTQTQLLTIPPTLTPVSEITVEVRLSGLTPEQLGFVRVHDVAADPTLRRSEPSQ